MQLFGMRKVLSLSAIFLFLGMVSCEKPEEKAVGLSTQPEEDQLSLVIDTTSIISTTVRQDSLRTDELSSALIGNMHDPIFGQTKAGIFTQLSLVNNNITFENTENYIIDSVILALEFNSTDPLYGALTAQEFEIYKVTEDFHIDSNYYSNTVIQHNNSNVLAQGNDTLITPNVSDSVIINGEQLPAQVRFRLNNDLANFLFDPNNKDALESNDDFIKAFQGYYIKSTSEFSPGQGGLWYMNLTSSNSKYTIYYRDTTISGEADTLDFDLEIDISTARFSTFEHEYSTTIEDQLTDSVLGNDKFYIQATAGLNGKLYFPNIKEYNNKDIAITKAELIIPVDASSIGDYQPQEQLLLYAINDSTLDFLADQFEGSDHIDGNYDEIEKGYRFTVTRFIQSLVSDNRYNALQVTSSAASVTANRVVLLGGNNATKKTKLALTYIKL